jgi:ribose/xylose/arabinose/galactoside ABC-type transport system permease subunit
VEAGSQGLRARAFGPDGKRLLALASARSVGLGLALLALIISMTFASPVFLTSQNMLNVGLAVSLTGVAAAFTTAVLISGSLDLSLGATVALSGMVGASVLQAGLPTSAAIVITLASGAAIGAANGFLVVGLGVNPFIATIGTAFMIRGIAYVVNDGASLIITRNSFLYLGQEHLFGVPVPIFFMFAAFAATWFALRFTSWGTHVYAIGSNDSAARRAGVKARRLRFAIYVLSSVAAGTAGLLAAAQSGAAFPYAALGFELDVIAAVILGGTSLYGGAGSVVGTLMGVALLGFLFNGINLLELKPYWQDITRGGALVIAIAIDAIRRGRQAE